MEWMRDNEAQYDLGLCDPPYGAGKNFNFRFDEVYDNDLPSQEYFDFLRVASKDQIIWGGNYFANMLPNSRCWLCWQKGNPGKNFSDFELAWTSFDKISLNIKLDSYGFNHADKKNGEESTIHPTQKPVSLYQYLLTNYAKEGDTILDTHGGSGSIAIACHRLKFSLDIIELDKEYFDNMVKRFDQVTAQKTLF